MNWYWKTCLRLAKETLIWIMIIALVVGIGLAIGNGLGGP